MYGQEIAYAWVPFGDLGQTHYLSINFRWATTPRSDRSGSAATRQRRREEEDDFEDHPTSRYSDYRNVYDLLGDDDRKSLRRPSDKDFQ